MKLKIDWDAGAAYLYVNPIGRKVAHTQQLDDNVNVDTDQAGDVVGIEILNVDRLDVESFDK